MVAPRLSFSDTSTALGQLSRPSAALVRKSLLIAREFFLRHSTPIRRSREAAAAVHPSQSGGEHGDGECNADPESDVANWTVVDGLSSLTYMDADAVCLGA